MTRMHNPPHPGEVLREYLGDITITEAAVKLGVNRVTLSRVVSGASGVSADMAYRLAQASARQGCLLGDEAAFCMSLRLSCILWRAMIIIDRFKYRCQRGAFVWRYFRTPDFK